MIFSFGIDKLKKYFSNLSLFSNFFAIYLATGKINFWRLEDEIFSR